MNRVFDQSLAFIFTSLLAAGATGCVAAEGDESFVIVNNLVPEIDESGQPSFTPAREGPFFSRGLGCIHDISFFVGSLFESRVQAAEGRESLRTIQIQGANISLEVRTVSIVAADGTISEVPNSQETIEFQTAFSSSLPPNAGLSVGIYDVVPFQIMASLRAKAGTAVNDPTVVVLAEVLTTTTAFGDFYGDRLDSTSFIFPVLLTSDAREGAPCFVPPPEV